MQKASVKQSQFLRGQQRPATGKATSAAETKRAKQSQFATGPSVHQGPCDTSEKEVGRGRPTHEETLGVQGQACETKPIPGGAGWDEATGTWDAGQSCETKPIGRGGVEERIVRNEANLSRSDYERAAGGRGRKRRRGWGQLCKTKPI